MDEQRLKLAEHEAHHQCDHCSCPDFLLEAVADVRRWRETALAIQENTKARVAAEHREAMADFIEQSAERTVSEIRDACRAERARCADVARALAMRAGSDGQEAMAEEIADAIRALPDER